MPVFSAELQHTFSTPAPMEQVHRCFFDVDTHIANFGQLASANKLDDHTVDYTLKAANYGVTTFQGRYTCRYASPDAQTITWSTLDPESNMQSVGTVRLTALPDGGTSIDYTATLGLDIDVPSMMAPMIKPVIRQVAAAEMKQFVKRMIRSAETQAAETQG